MKKRLFLAINLSEAYLAAFDKLIQLHFEKLTDAKWVRPENQHVTVCFFGGVEEENIPALIETLRQTLKSSRPFFLQFGGFVFAPPGRSPRMIWAAFGASEEFTALSALVHRNLRQFIEKGPHVKEAIPHVTLARFKNRIRVLTLEQPREKLPPLEVSSCTLYASELLPEGPQYMEITAIFL